MVSIASQDLKKSNEFTIIISKHIIKLLYSFYHDVSYAGELKIRLLDRIVLGGKHSILQLIMKKEPGLFGAVNNSFYEFYLEFSSKVPNSTHPVTRTIEFKQLREIYEPALSEENLSDIINYFDKRMLNIHAQEYFNCNIVIKVESDEKIVETLADETKNKEKRIDTNFNQTFKYDKDNTFTIKSADDQIFTYKGNTDLTLKNFNDY